MTKGERLAEFLKRLSEAPSPSSHDDAFRLIERTLNAVEDEFSGVPYNPATSQSDGRMYPPAAEFERAVPGRTDVRAYRQRGHYTYIGSNGAIEIRSLKGETIVAKPGKNGKGVFA